MTNRSILTVVLLSLNILICKAQWPRWYTTATNEKVQCVLEAYDKGYLIAGTISNSNTNKGYGLLMKTDVNGNILWKKLYGDATGLTQFHTVIRTSDGGMALSGSINLDTALFVKLNPCGEVVWSRIVLDRNSIFSTGIIELADSSLQTMVTNRDFGNPYDARTLFFKLNKNGNFIHSDSLPQNEFCQPNPLVMEIIQTNDDNYMLTSSTINIGGPPFWIKTNTEMEELWDLCWPDFHMSSFGKTVQSSNGDYFTTSGAITGGASTHAPKIFKFDQNGVPIKVIDSLKPQLPGFVYPGPICIFNDTVLVAGFAFENWNNPNSHSSYLVVTDTSGNKLEEIQLSYSKNIPAGLIKTYDNRLIALYLNMNNDITLCKFQYTNPTYYFYYAGLNSDILHYDTLCSYPFVSDTTALNPVVITGIPGYQSKNEQRSNIRIWPNPGSETIHVSLNEVVKNGDQLLIVNEIGQEIKTISINNSSKQFEIDITSLLPGIYFIQHSRQGLILGNGKLIVGN